MEGAKVGQERNDNELQMTLLWIPPGKYVMGSPKEEAGRFPNEEQIDVTLTKGFWFGKYEVRQRDWHKLMQTRPWRQALLGSQVKEGDDFPAVHVDWHMAREFCVKLTAEERQSGRLPADWEYTLPTEAQWEYACRAGTTTRYSFGDDVSKLPEYAWFEGNANDVGETYAHRIGQKKPNPWGLFDMHGNVLEWCLDENVLKSPTEVDRRALPEYGQPRVFRSGCWKFGKEQCRSAFRNSNWGVNQSSYLGFRVALVPVTK